eukprot:CAMPEP_0197027954 /NCGR_PEP_ID=MMETSP1384-20130603/7795_1 /TAXON_ID=29189 /ORGANISM="Ammonia sp." /LENGTH=348 /DNA_ID=CAMNT_0042456883 /DNA_START=1245 /DNA_END=2291 /DNA_ORIENTATION=+
MSREEKGVAIVLSMGNYANDVNAQEFNAKVDNLVDLQSRIWGPKNMGYEVITLNDKSPYMSKNGLTDFIKETRFAINNNNYDYLVINVIGKGNQQHLITSDNERLSWLQIYKMFSFAGKYFVPTVLFIDMFSDAGEQKRFESSDVDDYGDNLNVFGYTSTQLDYFGFVTNALYQRKNAVYLKDVLSQFGIWREYIWTVPKEIDFDDEDANHFEYKQRETEEDTQPEPPSMFEEIVKRVVATEPGGENWSISYSIDRKSWSPFLAKYDYSAYAHDHHNNRKEVKSVQLLIERPIGKKQWSKFKKVLQNGSFVHETLREEGANAVGSTALSVMVNLSNNITIFTPKIRIN